MWILKTKISSLKSQVSNLQTVNHKLFIYKQLITAPPQKHCIFAVGNLHERSQLSKRSLTYWMIKSKKSRHLPATALYLTSYFFPLPSYILIFLNILFQRTLPLSLQVLNLSRESQTMEALPTMWSSGTKPQKRESALLWRLSPIMK